MTSPIRRWQVFSTVTVLVLSVLTAASGLLRPGHYNDPAVAIPQYYAQDGTILLVGVPALALGLWYARRGSLRGRLVWLGALAYMTYMWASIGLQVAFNRFFLVYVVLFALSAFTLVGGLLAVDADAVRRQLADDVSERFYGGFVLLIALGLAVLWLAEAVPAVVTGTPPPLVEDLGPQAMVSHFVDLGLVVPSLTVVGVWLWQGRPWGYVLGGVCLVFGAILAPSITAMTVVFLLVGEVTVPLVAVVFTALPALVAAALAVKYVFTISSGTRVGPSADVGHSD